MLPENMEYLLSMLLKCNGYCKLENFRKGFIFAFGKFHEN